MRTRRLTALALSAVLALSLGAWSDGAQAALPSRSLTIEVLSNRADLVSGGDVLLAVPVPATVEPSRVRVLVGDRDVTSAFTLRGSRLVGLVDGLALGDNVVRAKAGSWSGQRVVTNHPNGGPIFSGPQHGPYRCQTGATDEKCNEPAR
ncbi:MAG TPA: DUF6351 family protein, partial [Nocardioides sp.]|nr:DUF6351 family protein [Nocardioides sp.]